MPTFRKKPVKIEAFKLGADEMPNWFKEAITKNVVTVCRSNPSFTGPSEAGLSHVLIKTLEGTHRGDIGDYIIQGVKGELYPCKSDIFEMTYEIVE